MLNYEVHGDPGGPTLMLLHGFMSSTTQWDLNVEALGEHLQVVLVELMGHGSSAVPEDAAQYSRSVVLSELERIRGEIAVDAWWVGGHSLGGATAIRYALAHADHTAGIVFTNTRAAFSDPGDSDRVVRLVTDAGEDLRSLPFHPIGAKHFPAELKARMVAIADAMHPHAVLNTVLNRNGWSSVNDLHRLEVPVLLVNGRFERAFQPFVPVAEAELPSIRIVHLDGGHAINIEQAAEFNAAVLGFIDEHRDAVPN